MDMRSGCLCMQRTEVQRTEHTVHAHQLGCGRCVGGGDVMNSSCRQEVPEAISLSACESLWSASALISHTSTKRLWTANPEGRLIAHLLPHILVGLEERLAKRAGARKLDDLTVGPVLTWTTQAMLDHINRLLEIPGASPDCSRKVILP